MLADKIKKPILLIHGEDDNNTGTFPMQSERFFAALKGHVRGDPPDPTRPATVKRTP